ncbi:hypothetical protein [Thermococcus sp. P6]|uniref:hypothetical protein n=1 Tax=Thermococcus sp. P6 TaxID=122420 RepID=UPI0012FD1585|nr:hypothetical protein [Thermococcus sp. P6]
MGWNRTAVRVALVYSGVTFFFALLFLMAGEVSLLFEVLINLLIIHDILSYKGGTKVEE